MRASAVTGAPRRLLTSAAALGISDEVEALGLKGSKRRKSRKLGEDYAPTMRPLLVEDMPKIIQALRQTSSKKILERLLGRIKLTEDAKALRQLLRLRILSMLGVLIEDYTEDVEVIILVRSFECAFVREF